MTYLKLIPILLIIANFVGAAPRIDDNRTPKLHQKMDKQPETLKLMTFNTWNLGRNVENGPAKIAKHIKLVDPDIVGIQEVTNDKEFYQFMEIMGSNWSYAYVSNSNTAIVTKHKIVKDDTYGIQAGIGSTVIIDDVPVHAYSMHLAYKAYGPYAANNKLVKTSKTIDFGEYFPSSYNRVGNIRNLINDKTFQKWLKQSSTSVPLIVFGDFNCPSHLDWTEETKDQHGDWVYKWPTTLLLQTKAKLVDSYREVHPDPKADPGITWSTVNKMSGAEWNYTIPEPQDRIDFIYYRSSSLKTIDSQVYAGDFKPYPADVKKNDWPTDHYSVVSKLEWVENKFLAENSDDLSE